MSELTKEQLEQDSKPLAQLPPEVLAMRAAVDQIDAFFAPHIARAKAARLCREAVEEERDDTLAEELAAWRAARAENDGEDVQP